MERSFHTLLAAASGGNFDVAITPGATIISDSDYSTVVFHVNPDQAFTAGRRRTLVQKLRWRSALDFLQFTEPSRRQPRRTSIVNRTFACTHVANLRATRGMSPGQVLSAPFGTCEDRAASAGGIGRRIPSLGEPGCASCRLKNAPTGKSWRDTT